MNQPETQQSFSVIIADDDPLYCKRAGRILAPVTSHVQSCLTGTALLGAMSENPVDLVLLDLHLPDMNGLKLLKVIRETNPDTEIVMVTGHSSVDSAVKAIKSGAGNYLCKPVSKHDLLLTVETAREKVLLRRENRWLRQALESQEQSSGVIGQCPAMVEVGRTIEKIASLNCNVLIQGDTGTGKQVVAKAIHRQSNRADKPLVTFNCGGFAEELIANELFGHEKGAFTGAGSRKIGLLESGHGGTVFLDEIGEMSLAMQAKLLHVIEEKRILRLGSVTPVDLDIRIIAATNRNLRERSQQGLFREDLYFRLNVVNVQLPPLVDRKEDLTLLISHFMAKYNRQFNKKVTTLSPEALDILMGYDYPGNVRELENILQRAIALSEGDTVTPKHLPMDLLHFSFESADNQVLQSLEEVEKQHIARVMRFAGGDRQLASAILGLPRTTLWRRLKKYRLEEC